MAVVGGAPSTGDPAVVAIVARSLSCPAQPPVLVCTGTAIGARVVLTAAHCVRDLDAAGLDVSSGTGLDGPYTRVLSARVHPDYVAGDASADLAVLVLDAPLASIAPTGSLALAAGATVRVVGFGATAGDATSAGVKHAGASEIAVVTAGLVGTVPGPALTCHGDSGGPVLAPGAGGEELVAVTSTGDPGCVLDSQAVRIDAHQSWLPAAIDVPPAPARPAYDAAVDLCTQPCASDDECPAGLACRGTCTLAGLPAGRLGEACAGDADGPCVAAPDGCRSFTACDDLDGSGCSAGGSAGWAALAVLPFLAAIARRFRRPQARGRAP